MIKAILFDAMGVIFVVGDDTQKLLVPYVRRLKPSLSGEAITAKYKEATLGKLTAEELWTEFGFHPDEIGRVQENYLESYVIDPSFFECAKELRKRYRLALLSNDVTEWSASLRHKFGIDTFIDKAFISGELGVRKPDPQIYIEAVKGMGVSAHECLFVDDSPDRVDAAISMGMSGVLFNREKHVYRGLQVRSFEQLRAILI